MTTTTVRHKRRVVRIAAPVIALLAVAAYGAGASEADQPTGPPSISPAEVAAERQTCLEAAGVPFDRVPAEAAGDPDGFVPPARASEDELHAFTEGMDACAADGSNLRSVQRAAAIAEGQRHAEYLSACLREAGIDVHSLEVQPGVYEHTFDAEIDKESGSFQAAAGRCSAEAATADRLARQSGGR